MENRDIRILLFSKLYPPDGSAQSLQMDKVNDAMNKSGCSTFVVAGISGKSIFQHPNVNNNNIEYVPYKSVGNPGFIIKRALNRLLLEFGSVNPHSEWIINCCEISEKIINHFRPDIILTTYYPFDTHIVGLVLKKQYGLPWIISFSDPWPMWINPHPYNIYKVPIFSLYQMHLLRRVLQECDAVHVTNDIALKLISEKSNILIGTKGYVIPHVSSIISDQNNSAIKEGNGWIAHVGQLTRERICPSLFEAIQEAVKTGLHGFKGLMLVGYVCNEVKILIKKYDLSEYVILTGQVDQSNAMKVASECSALLVIEGDMSFSPFLPSKFVDYVATNTPIISITPSISSIRDYSVNIKNSYVVHHDKNEIYSAIMQIFQNEDYVHVENNQIFSNNIIGNKYNNLFKKILNL